MERGSLDTMVGTEATLLAYKDMFPTRREMTVAPGWEYDLGGDPDYRGKMKRTLSTYVPGQSGGKGYVLLNTRPPRNINEANLAAEGVNRMAQTMLFELALVEIVVVMNAPDSNNQTDHLILSVNKAIEKLFRGQDRKRTVWVGRGPTEKAIFTRGADGMLGMAMLISHFDRVVRILVKGRKSVFSQLGPRRKVSRVAPRRNSLPPNTLLASSAPSGNEREEDGGLIPQAGTSEASHGGGPLTIDQRVAEMQFAATQGEQPVLWLPPPTGEATSGPGAAKGEAWWEARAKILQDQHKVMAKEWEAKEAELRLRMQKREKELGEERIKRQAAEKEVADLKREREKVYMWGAHYEGIAMRQWKQVVDATVSGVKEVVKGELEELVVNKGTEGVLIASTKRRKVEDLPVTPIEAVSGPIEDNLGGEEVNEPVSNPASGEGREEPPEGIPTPAGPGVLEEFVDGGINCFPPSDPPSLTKQAVKKCSLRRVRRKANQEAPPGEAATKGTAISKPSKRKREVLGK